MTALEDFIRWNKSGEPFRPYAVRDGSALTVYFSGEADYADPVSKNLTIYRAIDTAEIVGVRIDGMPVEIFEVDHDAQG